LSDMLKDHFDRPIWTFNDVSGWRPPVSIKGKALKRNNTYDVVALGDVNMDYIVRNQLPFSFASLISSGTITPGNIEEAPGGSGLNFCVCAKEAGYRTLLLAKVGIDYSGNTLTTWLNDKGIAHPKDWSTTSPTGKAVIAYDKKGVRLLVNTDNNANRALSVQDVVYYKSEIESCKVLYISGYCVSDPEAPRFAAAMQTVKFAKGAPGTKPIIIFDVVPHTLYEKISTSEFLEYTKDVDVLISEVATIRRFFGLGSKDESVDSDLAHQTAGKLAEEHRCKKIVLRFGPSGCDEEVIWEGPNRRHRSTNYAASDEKRGFGDRLTIELLRELRLL